MAEDGVGAGLCLDRQQVLALVFEPMLGRLRAAAAAAAAVDHVYRKRSSERPRERQVVLPAAEGASEHDQSARPGADAPVADPRAVP